MSAEQFQALLSTQVVENDTLKKWIEQIPVTYLDVLKTVGLKLFFDLIDKNGDAGVSKEEMGKFFKTHRNLDLRDDQIQKMMHEFKLDEKGRISFDAFQSKMCEIIEEEMAEVEKKPVEFATLFKSLMSHRLPISKFLLWAQQNFENKSPLRSLIVHMFFWKMDKDGNNFISMAELKEVFIKLNLSWMPLDFLVQNTMEAIDLDGDKQIDFTEFSIFMKQIENDLFKNE